MPGFLNSKAINFLKSTFQVLIHICFLNNLNSQISSVKSWYLYHLQLPLKNRGRRGGSSAGGTTCTSRCSARAGWRPHRSPCVRERERGQLVWVVRGGRWRATADAVTDRPQRPASTTLVDAPSTCQSYVPSLVPAILQDGTPCTIHRTVT